MAFSYCWFLHFSESVKFKGASFEAPLISWSLFLHLVGSDKGYSSCLLECISKLQELFFFFVVVNFWYLPLLCSLSPGLHSASPLGIPLKTQLLLAEFTNILESDFLVLSNIDLNFVSCSSCCLCMCYRNKKGPLSVCDSIPIGSQNSFLNCSWI